MLLNGLGSKVLQSGIDLALNSISLVTLSNPVNTEIGCTDYIEYLS